MAEGFLKQNARWLGGGFLLTFCSSFGQTFFISASVAEWQTEFGLSHGEFGRLYMLATLGSALTLPFLGRWVDVLPEHRTLMLVMPILAAAGILVAVAPNVMLLCLGLYGLRLFGQGMLTHTAQTAIGRWFSARRGRAVSLINPGHQLGEAILPAIAVAATLAFGWRAVWVGGSALLVVLALPLAVWAFRVPRIPKGAPPIDAPQDDGQRQAQRQWTRQEVLTDPLFWLLLVGVLAAPFMGTTVFFHQDHLSTIRDWPPGLLASAFPVMAAMTVVFGLIAGGLVDRYGAARVLPVYLLPLGIACALIALTESPMGLFAFMAILGISYGFSSTLFGALWPEIYGTENLGAVRSIAVAMMVLATAAGPGLTGTLMDAGVSLPTQMLFMAGYCFGAAGVMVVTAAALRRRALKDAP